jgi:hypothetical protein
MYFQDHNPYLLNFVYEEFFRLSRYTSKGRKSSFSILLQIVLGDVAEE